MKNSLTTAAGPAKKTQQKTAPPSAELVDAINQVFALFQLNYHNQYHKAYGTGANLNHAKRLWLEMLAAFEPEAILRAGKGVIETSEYLPTLRTMIKFCEEYSSRLNLPDARSAYVEACRAPSPKAEFAWSHPAVYYAGKASDWYFLQTSVEAAAFPVFRQHYEEICGRVRAGASLEMPSQPALASGTEHPLDKQENAKRLAELRRQLDL